MDGNHPKRRKDKYNPYTIYQDQEGQAFLSFIDGESIHRNFKIAQELYELFDTFELEDLSYMNVVDRHIEQSELSDESMNERVALKPISVEEEAIRNMCNKELHQAIMTLPEMQRRRLILYYFAGFTYEQIAEMEGCKHPAIIKSVNAAIRSLKKYFSK